ncbi:Non-hem dioxygenase N-terminal domain [Dillenia turbinata]|uniref:Non-hem dioxygenase N-terminal domain n=1 Tax=Dillenia turbinata TaxID=194707 RepID=A0AAN8Z162_9MAGN
MAPSTLTALAEEKILQASFVRDEDERPKVPYNEFSNEIPVISLDGIDEIDGRRAEICKKIVEACEDWGIFQVVDHGVDSKLITGMTRLAREFFALPPEEKLRFDMSGGKKGGFIVSSHLQEYSEKLMGLACKLLEVLSEAMGLEKEALTKACADMDQKDQVRGLQATNDGGKTWITAEPVEGAFVVNLVSEQLEVQECRPSSCGELQLHEIVNCHIPKSSPRSHCLPIVNQRGREAGAGRANHAQEVGQGEAVEDLEKAKLEAKPIEEILA